MLKATMAFPSLDATQHGQDIYSFDEFTPGGIEYGASESIALIDDTGAVVQFVSFEGKTVSPTSGPAAGATSQSLGFLKSGQTFETTDGGASYSAQSAPSRGTIPCYATGTRIETPCGPRRIETLRAGDLVTTVEHGAMPIRWTNAANAPLRGPKPSKPPVLIRAGALGPGCPSRDLIVSPQHRILAGSAGQLHGFSDTEVFVPSEALTGLRRVRFMHGRRSITWHHFLLDRHTIVVAEGCWTESLLPGPMVRGGLDRPQRRALRHAMMPMVGDAHPARPCLTMQAARRLAALWAPPGSARSVAA
ncbi:Hint domain-containing protein [uncultured Jannaschia sp.]|uniref:Hint domain-containing protein n=1 Tax=uncultured Jannaschia sp. TaxID=293347 RepID=UPI00260B82DF|nr:Hint domain-containing protein [uncultured Jannaschia sp.]